jgi:hypothetical protein
MHRTIQQRCYSLVPKPRKRTLSRIDTGPTSVRSLTHKRKRAPNAVGEKRQNSRALCGAETGPGDAILGATSQQRLCSNDQRLQLGEHQGGRKRPPHCGLQSRGASLIRFTYPMKPSVGRSGSTNLPAERSRASKSGIPQVRQGIRTGGRTGGPPCTPIAA